MYWKNTPLKKYVYASVLINLITVIIIIVCILANFLPPVVPLYYGLPSGANQLVNNWKLLVAPISGFIITAINLLLSFMNEDVYIKKTLVISSLLISSLSTITVIKIILLIGLF